MPFHVLGAGILCPRPGAPTNQAYFAGPLAGAPLATPYIAGPPPPPTAPNVWNQQALLPALTTTGIPPTGPKASECYLYTGASSHMSSNAGNLSSHQPLPSSPSITVGNGATLPVTHRASSAIATTRPPLLLNNILVSPSLVKNLISIRSLTRENNVSVEFDPFGFSIKDLPAHTEMLRCNSSSTLYPLGPSSPEAFVAATSTVDVWHQHLGHPGRRQLHQTLSNIDFTPTRLSSSTCEACQHGKHVSLPFSSSVSVNYVPFQIVHADV